MIFVILLIILFPSWAFSTTYTCGTDGVDDSCSTSTMATLISGASDGDTINVANATHSWSSYVEVTKRLTIDGGGTYTVSGYTQANHANNGTWKAVINLSNGSGNTAFYLNSTSGTGRITIRGFKFTGNTKFEYTCSYSTNQPNGAICTHGNNIAEYIITNNWFNVTGVGGMGYSCVFVNQSTGYGLVYNNYFEPLIYHGHVFFVQRLGTLGCGDQSWYEADDFGTANFVIIEDNVIVNPSGYNCSAYPGPVLADAQSSGRYVFRYNYVEQSYMGNHGEGSGGYCQSGRAFEVYNNTFYWPSGCYFSFLYYIRGGTMRFHNNTLEGYQVMVRTWVERVASSNLRWLQCDGTHAWDGNTSPTGYPCINQPGMGQWGTLITCPSTGDVNQATSPFYIWNNTTSRMMPSSSCDYVCTCSESENDEICHNNPTYVVSNRDYYYSADSSAAPVGYSTYTYPHAWRTDAPTPAKVQGLTISGGSLR